MKGKVPFSAADPLAKRPKEPNGSGRRNHRQHERETLAELEKGSVMKSTGYFEEIELDVEELEPVIAPSSLNHNEMLISDELELTVEELEEVIAPSTLNHNETLAENQ